MVVLEVLREAEVREKAALPRMKVKTGPNREEDLVPERLSEEPYFLPWMLKRQGR